MCYPELAFLEKYHAAFADWVAKCTGIGLDMKLPIFRGASFMGDEAVELKYIDAMGGLNDAIKWVFAKATSQKGNSLFK